MNAPEARAIVIAAASITLALGEEYAGIALVAGKPSHHLVLLPGDVSKKLEDACKWAKEQGGELPTRSEQALLYAHLKDSFERDWYWSNERHADDADYAWYQYFGYGYQHCYDVSNRSRARAVRRVPIS